MRHEINTLQKKGSDCHNVNMCPVLKRKITTILKGCFLRAGGRTEVSVALSLPPAPSHRLRFVIGKSCIFNGR